MKNRLMVLMTLTVVFASGVAAASPAKTEVGPSADFLKYWKSGYAEIASYEAVTERYGEMRKAQAVLIFVYEETHAKTRIKIESDRASMEQRVPTLKLNHVLKFNTGIYDYSVMTSVFAGLSGAPVKRPFQPLKVSFTSQEWCGQVYQHVLPRANGVVSQIHSYFEAEGDSQAVLAYPKGTLYYEDELPLLLRELDGDFMASGETRKIDFVPSLWERRKRHQPLAITQGMLTKKTGETFRYQNQNVQVTVWTLESGGMTTTYRIESTHPKKLLAWENSRGEKGELLHMVRKPYWKLNGNQHEKQRRELGLRYGLESEN